MAYQKGASELKDKIAIIQQLFTDISVMYSSDDPEAARLRQAHLDSVNRITIPIAFANVSSSACVLLTFAPDIQEGMWLWWILLNLLSLGSVIGWWLDRNAAPTLASPQKIHRETLYACAFSALWAGMILLWFPDASAIEKMTIGVLFTGMIGAGAFVLSPLPFASVSHVAVNSVAVLGALWLASDSHYIGIVLLLGVYSFMVLTGSLFAWRKSTDLIAAEARSARQEQTLAVLLHDFEHNAGDALWETRSDGFLNHISTRLIELLDLTQNEQEAQTFHQILVERCPEQVDQLAPLTSEGTPFRDMQLKMGSASGTRYLLMTGKCLYSSSDIFLGWRGVLSDVSDKLNSEKQLRELAHTDSLTGLANRFKLRETLSWIVSQQLPLALLSIDLDRFKSVNDNHGHSVGDAVLRVVAKRLRHCVAKDSLIARLGGDEFAIALWSEEGVSDRMVIAQKVIGMLADPITLSERLFRVGASVGIVVRTDAIAEIDDLMVQADIAMYAAKDAGRECWVEYSSRLGAISHRRRSIEQGLRTAIEREEISLFWQPKVDLVRWQIIGAEALMRWRHSELGDISPTEFIPVAEQCGMIDQLGEWALREACRAGTQELAGLTVAVNVSALQLQLGDYIQCLKKVLRESGLPPAKLELELTESVLIDDTDRAVHILDDIRSIGVRLALDDFGTGYSSLSYLRRFPFDTLKIDRSFVTELLTKPDARAIVKMISDLAKELGKRTICEGVETVEQLELICAAGCDEVQGYLISAPCALIDFPQALDPALNPHGQGKPADLP